jgi:diguanylate cyclase (GGDEF)-like protein
VPSELESVTDGLIDLALTADGSGAQTLADLARVVPVLPPTTTCQELERSFGRDAALSCVLLRHPTVDEVLGLVQRRRFEALMSGPFGYGRALHSRSSAGDFAQWDALVLRPTTGVVEAASRAITRPSEMVDDDVLVQGAQRVGVVPMPVLLAALARSLAGRALRDPLTGLANRDAFFGRVEEACRRSATQPGHATAVIYLDLDRFKGVNDSLGHGGGDDLLRQIAEALTRSARPTDLVARIGGDEFAVCVECDTGREDHVVLTAAIARRLRSAVNEAGPSRGPATGIRVSIGLSVTGDGLVAADDLVRAADLAMYRAKRAGGDRCTGPVVVTSSAEADPLVGTSVTDAAGRGELLLHFQPIVRLDDARLISVEALVRWQHPQLGLLHPGAFLPAVERAGQLADLDTWVLRTACRQFAAWPGSRSPRSPRIGLNVNLSVAGLLMPDVVDRVLEAARAAQLDPEVLRVEVPEDLLAEHIEAVTPVLQQLAAAGVAVIFDDVGAGSTSLRHLRNVAADGLKIDRSYVTGMLDSERDRAVVRLLIDFALGTGARITAEGIETERQRELLRSMGCVYGQGWLFAQAAPLADLADADSQEPQRT